MAFAAVDTQDVLIGQSYKVNRACEEIRHLSGVAIEIETSGSPDYEFIKGIYAKAKTAREWSFVALASGSVSIRMSSGIEIRDTRMQLVDDVVTKSNSPAHLKGVPDVTIAGGGATKILDDLSMRVEALITNLSTTVTARICSDGCVPTSSLGVPIYPGQQQVITTQDEIQAYNPSGAAMTFAVAYTERA